MTQDPILAIRYLGHAGFCVEYQGIRILMDPWFFPAFLESWFPFPNNRDQLDFIESGDFQFLYISHTHEDHLDPKALDFVNRSAVALVPKYRTESVSTRLSDLGFRNQIVLGSGERKELGPNLYATMVLDESHKEDSGLLVEADGTRFLNLNDCNPRLSQLPKRVDLLAAQFSGAQWYPGSYDYPTEVMERKVSEVRTGLLENLARKVIRTNATHYLPSAGPPCFLDPELAKFNDREKHIFSEWTHIESSFRALVPGVSVREAQPGDRIFINRSSCWVEARKRNRDSSTDSIVSYSKEREQEWAAYYAKPTHDISDEDIRDYFNGLVKRNQGLVHEYKKLIRLVSGDDTWSVSLGQIAQEYEIEGEEPFDPQYVLKVPSPILNAILDGVLGWEEALLSLRIELSREPDVYDTRLMALLRYGHEPAQIGRILRERAEYGGEMISRGGFVFQRYCPHAGEDLACGEIRDGILECPRHHWRWDLRTGKCISGGDMGLLVRPSREE